MTWVGRFGKRPHGLVRQDELFSLVLLAKNEERRCHMCEEKVAGLLHCNDCGRTWRMCENHRPNTPAIRHIKRLHEAVCVPVKGSD